MMPLKTGEMKGPGIYAGKITQGVTPKSNSESKKKAYRGVRPPYQMGSNPRLIEDDFQGSVDP